MQSEPNPSGFLLINKQVDWTSHDVVAKLRGLLKTKKIGHAGTLDPFATGLLIVGVERAATKHLDWFHQFPKTYDVVVELGATSTTEDATGEITTAENAYMPTEEEIKEVIGGFLGKQDQIPPMYSAKKVDGQKLYSLARQGKTIEREPAEITIHEIKLNSYSYPLLDLTVSCSTGTYIRSLARDIGEALKTGGFAKELRRTEIGPFSVEKSLTLDELKDKDIHSLLFFPEQIS